MKFIRTAIIVIVGIGVIAAVGGLFLPRDVRVERSVQIDAPPSVVYTIVNSLRTAPHWSPWLQVDPETELMFEGPSAGPGNKMTWKSDNKSIGSGTQEIIASEEGRRVRTRVAMADFGNSDAEFILSPTSTGTQVTWTFEKRLGANPVERYFGLMFDTWVGPDYEQGLGNLKLFAEKLPKVEFADFEIDRVVNVPKPVLITKTGAEQDMTAFRRALGNAYMRLARVLEGQGEVVSGAPVSISIGAEGAMAIFEAGLPVSDTLDREAIAGLAPHIQVSQTPGGNALRITHIGSYDNLPQSYSALLAYALASGERVTGATWNEYVSDPTTTQESELRTYVYLPVE